VMVTQPGRVLPYSFAISGVVITCANNSWSKYSASILSKMIKQLYW
jgi:hypothetical protein